MLVDAREAIRLTLEDAATTVAKMSELGEDCAYVQAIRARAPAAILAQLPGAELFDKTEQVPVCGRRAARFFAFDENNGFELFDTANAARKACQEEIDELRADAGEGWDETVDNICWGMVLGTTKQIELPDDYDGSCGLADYMKPVDYVLTDAAPAVPVLDEERELAAYQDWFDSQQGIAYDGMWEFARAAWLRRAALREEK